MRAASLRRTHGLLVAAVTFVVASGAAVYLLGRDGSTHGFAQSGPGARPLMAMFDPKEPLFPYGERTTLDDAAAKAGYEIFRPMSAGDPSEVWISEAGEGVFEVGLRYGGDLVVLLAPWPKGKDAAESFARQTRDFGTGYTTTIAGNPARVRPYDPDKDEYPLDVVHVAIGGVGVSLYGTSGESGTSIVQDLLALAGDLGA